MKDISVIIVAAGESKRLKTRVRKPYLILKGKPILLHSLEVFRKIPNVHEIVIAINPKDSIRAEKIISPINNKPVQIKTVIGGARRSDSVCNALKATSNKSKIVLIHDAARPFVKHSDVLKLIREIRQTGAAILARPVSDTIKRTKGDIIKETITPRQSLWAAQTPQGFKRDILIKAYQPYLSAVPSILHSRTAKDELRLWKAGKKSPPPSGRDSASASGEVTDDASLVEKIGIPVSIVKGSEKNIKITTKTDIQY
jgi:2-C-methyl-D-erythritol 4-phosphate cytidylyltransferase